MSVAFQFRYSRLRVFHFLAHIVELANAETSYETKTGLSTVIAEAMDQGQRQHHDKYISLEHITTAENTLYTTDSSAMSTTVYPFMGTLKPQSNGPLYSTVIGTLAVDVWYGEDGPRRAAAPLSPLLAVPNVTVHPSTASVPTSYHLMWNYNCLCTQKG